MSAPLQVEEKILLGLNNRDGEILLVKTSDGRHFLVAEAGTFHNAEFFAGCGSTEQIEISAEAFKAFSVRRDAEGRPLG